MYNRNLVFSAACLGMLLWTAAAAVRAARIAVVVLFVTVRVFSIFVTLPARLGMLFRIASARVGCGVPPDLPAFMSRVPG